MGSIPENEFVEPKRRMLVHTIEEKAKWQPHETFVRYAPVDWEKNCYQAITWRQYANAIDKVAYLLDEKLGKATKSEVVAYFGPNDARYTIMLPACIKNRRTLTIPDGRLTKEGLMDLLSQTNCKTWLYADDHENGLLVGADSGFETLDLPSLDWMFYGGGEKRYLYEKTFEEAAWDDILIIHTSGTTGKMLGGLHAMIIAPVYFDCPCVILPLDVVCLSPKVFKTILQMSRVDGIKCPPHTITTLYEDAESKALLKSLKFVAYLRAALDQAIGDDLCQHTQLTALIGSTETGEQVSVRPANRMLWHTHDYVPENGRKTIPLEDNDGLDDVYELVFDRSEDGVTDAFQGGFWNPAFKNINRIETNELYRPVKDSDSRTRWAFAARKDDLTKLNWLAKFRAQDIEQRIQKHADVHGVFVGGEGRPTPYVIIEMKEGVLDVKSEEQLLDEIYQTAVLGTNHESIDEIQIPKETVMIAKKEKPFKRNLKQVILRRQVEKDYSEEIEQAYSCLGQARQAQP